MKKHGLIKHRTTRYLSEYLLSLRLLGDTDWPEAKQLACLYALSNHTEQHYTPFTIQKPNGTPRELLSPDPLLKKIQRNILRNLLEGKTISPHATAYYKGAGILQNAARHKGQKLILKMDIRDFFGSIAFPMACQAAFPRSLYPPAIAVLLTNLCCYRNYLPQGAPTSAAISNLVMKPFDDFMGKWCREQAITYTRYCDDMTFSGDFMVNPIIGRVKRFLFAMGFEVRESKTKIIPGSNRQSVTGIVVNKTLRAPIEYRDKLRQEIYYCNKYGAASHLIKMNDKRYLPPKPKQISKYLKSLLGRINFVLHIDPHSQYFLQAKASIQTLLK